MTKRLLLKLGLVGLLGAGLFVAWLWWTTPTSGINWASANRIQVGMTQDEVQAIIGQYPTVYKISCGPRGSQSSLEWRSAGNEAESISVRFDVNGQVTDKSYNSDFMTFLDKLRRWLHLA